MRRSRGRPRLRVIWEVGHPGLRVVAGRHGWMPQWQGIIDFPGTGQGDSVNGVGQPKAMGWEWKRRSIGPGVRSRRGGRRDRLSLVQWAPSSWNCADGKTRCQKAQTRDIRYSHKVARQEGREGFLGRPREGKGRGSARRDKASFQVTLRQHEGAMQVDRLSTREIKSLEGSSSEKQRQVYGEKDRKLRCR